MPSEPYRGSKLCIFNKKQKHTLLRTDRESDFVDSNCPTFTLGFSEETEQYCVLGGICSHSYGGEEAEICRAKAWELEESVMKIPVRAWKQKTNGPGQILPSREHILSSSVLFHWDLKCLRWTAVIPCTNLACLVYWFQCYFYLKGLTDTLKIMFNQISNHPTVHSSWHTKLIFTTLNWVAVSLCFGLLICVMGTVTAIPVPSWWAV